MHDGSQVQGKRRKNASYSKNLRTEVGYRCECGKECKTYSGIAKHGKRCSVYIKEEKKFKLQLKKEKEERSIQEGKIKCDLCDFFGNNLTQHIKKMHIGCGEYRGQTLSEKSKKVYSEQNKQNGDWINREKEKGADLTWFFEKNGLAVSESILSNEEERKRRALLLGKLNKTEDFRKRASEVAKKTSARPEILARRANALKRWREENPDDFYNKCTLKMINSYETKTRPEKYFHWWLEERYPLGFKYSQFVESKLLPLKSKRKQIDFVSVDRKIFIEIDGPLHFLTSFKDYEKIKEKDLIINEVLKKRQKILIRVSHDQWNKRTGEFSKNCLDQISKIIEERTVGNYFLGENYGKNNCL